MSVLTGVHRTNDHTAHNFSAPTEKNVFYIKLMCALAAYKDM
ncbi:hypothetical protein HMPREF1144_5536 [Klebsiella sp. OBRC7]|nr:hypothetical protein HMPREF1144_5536 [Klebsiella sp. OBRC7]